LSAIDGVWYFGPLLLFASMLRYAAFDVEPKSSLSLTMADRLVGFLSCFALGMLISLLSLFSLGRPMRFGITYTLGNVVTLLGSAFLCGFKRQWDLMTKKSRRGSSALFVVFMVATFATALTLPKRFWPLVLLLVVCQWVSLLWYTLSYFPGGQTIAKTVVVNVLKAPVRRGPFA
jgi:hypothetical protein